MKLRKSLTFLGIALLVFVLAGCEKKAIVGSDMNGGSVEIEKGQVIVLKLASNPTTGYDWEITGLDTAILQQVGEVDYKSDSNLVGSGGINTWTFKAVGSGETHLTLIYHRSFEKDIPPLEMFDLDIVVK
jgi:inhibitor of cysteine peptidase